MRIGVVVTDYPALSETFIRREVDALRRAGHRVIVYTHSRHHDPLVVERGDEQVVTVPFLHDASSLEHAARADDIEHFHSSLMVQAHRAALRAARALQVPVTFRVYSGHDVFTRRDAALYAEASRDPLVAGFIAEDQFMADWLVTRLGADRSKIHLIANSLDLTAYRPRERRSRNDSVVILSIARFVQKKGLLQLIEAFNLLAARRADVQLRIVGRGPEEGRLRQAAAGNTRVEFLGAVPTEDTLDLYASADIFCVPCVQADDGDADGIPTTTLEAMACELAVVTSDLLSAPSYITDGCDGLLVPPGDVTRLSAALERLCTDPTLRRTLGVAARQRVAISCDEERNTARLAEILLAARNQLWRTKLAALESSRATYSDEREQYYIECRKRAIDYFHPAGRILEIGCGQGKFRLHLPDAVTYHGCDVAADSRVRGAFPFVAARGEALPYRDASFDGAVLFATLSHVFDIDAVLSEAARVIKPGGHLYVQECYNDPNPVHLNHLSDVTLHRRISEHFRVVSCQPANHYLMWMIGRRPETRATKPLVSVGLTVYNRAAVVRRAIDSVLAQTYAPVEVIVVNDGSTDDTAAVLDSYGSAIRVVTHARNQGRAISKNDSLLASRPDAEYVAVLDSDDYFHPTFVERCVGYLQEHPAIGLVYTDDVLVTPQGRVLREQRAVDPWSIELWLRTRNLRGDTWVARRDLVMQTALMDPELALDVDYDLFYQLLELTTFGHLPECLVTITDNPEHSSDYLLEQAACHAANLIKYGYSPEYAYLRARSHPEWVPAIERGIKLGHNRRAWRQSIRREPSLAAAAASGRETK